MRRVRRGEITVRITINMIIMNKAMAIGLCVFKIQ